MTKVYRATIEVLTPVHIGIFEFETFSFFEKDDYLYLVDWDKIFKDSLLFEELKKTLDKSFKDKKEFSLCFENDFIKKNKDNILKKDLTQFKIKINKNVNRDISSSKRNLRFNIRYFNFEKERYLPYIPGSSLKGALAKVFSFNKYQAQNILLSDFYLEDEDKDSTEIFFAQRYYIQKSSSNEISNKEPIDNFHNLVEMFVPGTKLVGEIKITENVYFSNDNPKVKAYLNSERKEYFILLSKSSKKTYESFKNLLKSGAIPILLGFGVGEDNAKRRYLVECNGEELPLGLTVLTLEEKNE